MSKAEIKFYLQNKETGEEKVLTFKTSKNPLKMAYRVMKIAKKLKKYDKTHNLVKVESDNEMLQSMFVSEIQKQKESVEKTGKPDLHGLPDISISSLKKKLKRSKRK